MNCKDSTNPAGVKNGAEVETDTKLSRFFATLLLLENNVVWPIDSIEEEESDWHQVSSSGLQLLFASGR